MDVNNPIQFDPRPNRRKDKDNPYTILTVGIETDTPHYFVSFTDNSGKPCCLEISKELYELFDRFELDDLYMAVERAKEKIKIFLKNFSK